MCPLWVMWKGKVTTYAGSGNQGKVLDSAKAGLQNQKQRKRNGSPRSP